MHIKILLTTLFLGISVACSTEWDSPNRRLFCYPARSGEQLGTFEKTNNTFTIRTVVFREKTFVGFTFIPGPHYIFETKGQGDEDWREFLAFRHDYLDPIDEDRSKFVDDRVEFVSDRLAFVYMGRMYAVTTDAGRSWTLWDGIDYRFPKGRMGYDGIQGIELLTNGVGVMNVNLIGTDEHLGLHTENYGVNWLVSEVSRGQ